MKKIAIILLCLALAVVGVTALAACDGEGEETTLSTDNTTEGTPDNTTEDVTTEETTAEETTAAFGGYKVTVVDAEGKPVAGVAIQMCDSQGCRLPSPTGADGVVTFAFPESDFHVTIASAVEGYVVDTAKQYDFEAGSYELTITLEKAA